MNPVVKVEADNVRDAGRALGFRTHDIEIDLCRALNFNRDGAVCGVWIEWTNPETGYRDGKYVTSVNELKEFIGGLVDRAIDESLRPPSSVATEEMRPMRGSE